MCWRCVPCLLLSEPFCWARSDYQSGDNKKSLTPVSAACRCFCLRSKPIAHIRRSDEPAMMAHVAPHMRQARAKPQSPRSAATWPATDAPRVAAASLSRTTRAIAYRHARLFQRGLHARKCRVERRAKIRYRYNNRNGNETVFDGGCSALVSQELLKRDAHHGYLVCFRAALPAYCTVAAPSLNGSLQINIPALAHSANLRKLSASCGARPPSNL